MKTIRKITTLALAMLLILECFAGAALATTPDAAEEPLVAVDEAMAEVESSEPEVTEAESVEPEIQLITVQAEAKASVVESGTCGENLSWELNSDGLLTISGEGKWMILFTAAVKVHTSNSRLGEQMTTCIKQSKKS